MSILSYSEILLRIATGELVIRPFEEKRLNPNSYNLRLGDKIARYALDPGQELDPRVETPLIETAIPAEGLRLEPGQLYLAATMEWTETRGAAPMLQGRSSIARLGLAVHVTAGFGDNGFRGRWTLELLPAHPVRVFAGMEICQIAYHTLEGDAPEYAGRYQDAQEAQACRLWRDAK